MSAASVPAREASRAQPAPDAPDLGHLGHRVAAGQGHFLDDDRRAAAETAERRLHAAARVLVDCFASGDLGGAKRHVQALRLDPEQTVSPWELALAATALAVRAGSSSQGG